MTGESKLGKTVKRISQVAIVGSIIFVIVLYLWPSVPPLEKEFNWFKENGYATTVQKYTDYLAYLPFYYTVNEVKLSKSDFKDKVEYLKQNNLSYKVRWCKDMGMLYVAQQSEEEDIMDIYHWEP